MSKDTQQQKQYNILIIGESCEDIYVYGEVNRISPEAPVPVLKKKNKEKKIGMAGNVKNNIVSMGKNINLIFSYFNESSLIKKIRFVDEKSKYQVMRYDIEKDIEPLQFEKIHKLDYDAIIISDYNKGYLSQSLISKVTKYFKKSKIFVDTKRKDLSSYHNCVIKLNQIEKESAFNINKTTDVITTLGQQGCVYQNINYPTKKVDVHDVCGAGDVFLAALVIGWLENKDLIKAIKIANSCASLSVTKSGCYSVKRNEYEDLCF